MAAWKFSEQGMLREFSSPKISATMEGAPAPATGPLPYQQVHRAQVDSQREHPGDAHGAVTLVTASTLPPDSTQISFSSRASQSSENTNRLPPLSGSVPRETATNSQGVAPGVAAAAANAEVAVAAPAKKKKRPSRVKKFLMADYRLFLNPGAKNSFCDDDVYLVGKIMSCPSAKNDYCYHISWSKNPENEWPVKEEHLWTWPPRSDLINSYIDEGIERFQRSGKSPPKDAPSKRKRDQARQQAREQSRASAPAPASSVATPAAIPLAVQAAASVRTSSSTVSSLTDNWPSATSTNATASSTRMTRNNQSDGVESETDDGSDLDEKDDGCGDDSSLDSNEDDTEDDHCFPCDVGQLLDVS